jgi:CheY-like chemotaxis protein
MLLADENVVGRTEPSAVAPGQTRQHASHWKHPPGATALGSVRWTSINKGRLLMAIAGANSPVVLIVEDHDDTREMLQLLLEVFGCRVIPAHDGEEAMSLVEKTLPDLILMDMRMPHLDGLSLTRMIRSHPTLNEVPIIAVTGMVTPQFKSEVLSAGCNDCLYKPIDFDRLEQLIKTLTPSAPRHELSSRSVITGQTW